MSDMSKYIKKSNIKCPICQTLLDVSIMSDKVFGCPKCRNMGNIDLWQALIDSIKEHDLCHDALVERTKESDHTRKALGVALDEINKIKVAAESVGIGFFMTAAISASVKIKTALEQKDVKISKLCYS